MPTRMNINPPQFEDVMNWLNGFDANNPKHISTIGNRSPHPFFLAWPENGAIHLRSHPEARVREYLLTRDEWEGFRTFRNGLDAVQQTRATSYINHPWARSRAFYPSVPALSWAFGEGH